MGSASEGFRQGIVEVVGHRIGQSGEKPGSAFASLLNCRARLEEFGEVEHFALAIGRQRGGDFCYLFRKGHDRQILEDGTKAVIRIRVPGVILENDRRARIQ